jgi:acyl-CoA thioesterase
MNEAKPQLETAEQINRRLATARFPFNQFLGVRVVEALEDGLTLETEVRPEWGNVFGSMHGGVTASLLDTAVGLAALRALGFARAASTVELKVNYLRPIQDGKITIRARILKAGKTLIVGAGDIFDSNGEHCATSLVTYMAL